MKLQAKMPATLLKRDSNPRQMFSCKIYENSENTYFEKHLWTTISGLRLLENFAN